ncbi:DUF6252 family protein [Tenacibaculum sp. TC6]|uniref:DUF6252 family protein n=1 Tax=Tenacibaculum sp. TC6 TaxID=3423223 RepID=UPI003D363BF2
MKLTTLLKKKLVLLALVATFTNCSKDDIIKPQTELPPITQTGENTVGCLVDGKVFLPYQKKPFGVPSTTCYYQFLDGTYEFGLSFFNNKQNPSSNIFIGGNKLEFIEGQTYQLKDEKNKSSAYAYVSIEGGGIYNYSTTDTITGELTITKLDPTKSIISGTFWFDAERITDGKIIKIREGRFDMQYTV